MPSKKRPTAPRDAPVGENDARRHSLSNLTRGAMNEAARMRATTPRQPVKGQHRGRGRGKPWTNIRALAVQHTPEAMSRLAELMHSGNDCVAFGATRAMLERGHGKEAVIHQGATAAPRADNRDLRVTIATFKEEKKHADGA